MTNKQLQAAVKAIVDTFEVNGTDDYTRMDDAVFDATSLRFDNKSIWNLVNRAKSKVERVTFTLED